jgi:RNA polymerase sigma-70 factor (ECF subfamily)
VGWRDTHDDPQDSDPVERAAAPFVDPADGVETTRRLARLWRAVEELSPQQRAAVLLQCKEGLATKEIAVILSLSEATVRVHLHRAMSALRKRVGDQA